MLQILFLDADSMPLMNPASLFDWPDYAAKGNHIIFPGKGAAYVLNQQRQLVAQHSTLTEGRL